MSLAFVPPEVRQGVPDHRTTVQALLNENSSLIKSIRDYLSMGRTEEAAKYQQLLHRNLIHLAQSADHSLLAQLKVSSSFFILCIFAASFALSRFDYHIPRTLQSVVTLDEKAPNDENCPQPPAPTESGTSGVPTPASSAPTIATAAHTPPVAVGSPFPVKPSALQSTPVTMIAPPLLPVQPQTAAIPPTSQPQMGVPLGPPQGYGYPPQGIHPSPQPVGAPPQVIGGYPPPQSYEQQLLYQQQSQQQNQQQYMR
ncbi:unnamed protein product [Nippostrongylus brasiliensis]|uniref:SSXT domain-containing protein n=1 Tax=Nippostrongylus brasiliensis TaxID=27835 RepID=A0A0N4YSE2_NIPBR|nr:unnamed protein product [Nippostrongylus brasiliensis]